MSAKRRIVVASAAGWVQVATLFGFQILAVPLYLSKWNSSTYAVWLLVQTAGSLLSLLDIGHQNYVGYLMIQAKSANEVSRLAFSAIPAGVCFGLLQFTVAIGFYCFTRNYNSHVFDYSTGAAAILIYSASWLIFGSVGGVFGRTLYAFKENHRLAWWTVANIIMQQTAPVTACLLGANVTQAAWALFAATATYNVLLFVDIRGIWKRDKVARHSISWVICLSNASKSLAVSGKEILLYFRQQGVRLLLAPLLTASAFTQFSITRTGSNVSLQGLTTVMTPIEPELLRYIRDRDQLRTEAIISGFLGFVAFLFVPAIVLIQFTVPYFFHTWTHGKIAFDGVLFSLLSATVIWFGISQPFASIVKGRNLLAAQLYIVIGAGMIVLAGIVIFVPVFGVRGAAASLLLSEVAASIANIAVATIWMLKNGLRVPYAETTLCFGLTLLSTLVVVLIGCEFVISMVLGLYLLILAIAFIIYALLFFPVMNQLGLMEWQSLLTGKKRVKSRAL